MRLNAFKAAQLSYLKLCVAFVSLGIVCVLLIWSLLNYRPVTNFYGPRAIYSLVFLSLLLALLGRMLLLRMLRLEIRETTTIEAVRQRQRAEWRPLFLFDITAPVYLAAGVLIGSPAAVLTTLVTQAFLQGYTVAHKFASWQEACYRVAAIGVVVLIATTIYTQIGGPPQHVTISHFAPITESKEFLGSILAAIIMMLLIALISLPLTQQVNSLRRGDLAAFRLTWIAYFRSPALRFQVLVLSVGPLVPVVDIFDDTAGEIAWLFFLVPLFAIYYLALISTRLSIRTSELQHTLRDLSSARRRQDELRDYASLITRVQEEERRRLARELHDDTAQALIALSLGLDGLRRAMGNNQLPERDVQWLSSLQDLADQTLDGVRRACRDLRPSVLDDLGLRAALEWLSDSSAARGVPCTFAYSGSSPQRPSREGALSPEVEIAVFRIVQEALANIWRHASATAAQIELLYTLQCVQVSIQDNGKGFVVEQEHIEISGQMHEQSLRNEPGALLKGKHLEHGLGLLGMRERATLIGATLAIVSAPGKGCMVVLSLPLL